MIHRRPVRPATILLLLALLLPAAILLCLFLGSAHFSWLQILSTLVGQGSVEENFVIIEMRLPRVVMCILIGIGISLSGAVMQAISRNDLASPDTVGVNAGSGLGMMLLLVVFPNAVARSPLLMPWGAIAGAAVIASAVYCLAYRRGAVLPTRLLLVGIAVGFAAEAAMFLFALRMSFSTYSYALTWMSGTLAGSDWKSILFLLPWIVIFVPLTLSRARVLDVLTLGDNLATGLGVAVQRQRLLLMIFATMLTGACVAIGGHIGFLGLAAPHFARRLVGYDHRILLPASALCGAILLLVADGLGRQVVAPAEMPAGVLVGIVGGCYFLFLLVTTKG